MSTLQISSLVSLGAFYALVMSVGIYTGRKRTIRNDADDLLVAGRGLPVLLGMFTMTATWVGGGYINGTAEAVYDPALGLVWCQAPWGYALSLIVGGLFFARPMRRAGYTTMLDPFQARYGNGTTCILFLAALLGDVFWSAAILAALGMSVATIFGLDTPAAIVISAAVVVGYTMVGGLWAVAYTDVLQLLCILFGLCLVIPFALEQAGGSASVFAEYSARLGAQDPFPGTSIWNWVDIALMLICGGIPWQVYFQRVLACRDEHAAVRLSIGSGGACLALAIPAVIIGAIGATVDWQAVGAEPPPIPSLVLPHVVYELTPPLVATIALGAIAAAVMSSMDSSVLSSASMFVWNVYRTQLRPRADDHEIRAVTRIAIVTIGMATTCLALSVQSVYALWYLCADIVYVVLFPQLVLVLFVRQTHRWGVWCGILAAIALRLGGGESALGIAAFIPYPLGSNFPFRTFAMITNLGLTVLVSRLVLRCTHPTETR